MGGPGSGAPAAAAGVPRQDHEHRFRRNGPRQPIPDDLTTNGHQQTLDQLKKLANGRTLRQTMSEYNVTGLSVELIGTPDSVAAQMGEAMEEVGGDGFLFSMPNVSRRLLAEIEDGLVPALQDRGLVRAAYGHTQFRDNLLEY